VVEYEPLLRFSRSKKRLQPIVSTASHTLSDAVM
jgi:hypothetical protein